MNQTLVIILSLLTILLLFIWMIYTSYKQYKCKHFFKKDIGQKWYYCEKCGVSNWRK